jgi:Holliday junction DNA helicase RuvA
MIGRLSGKVVDSEGGGVVVLDVGGVGYELVVPVGTLGRARADDSGRVTLWVHTHVREDTLALFGFASDVERTAFRLLLSISNVGPKIAVAVLGALPVPELSRAVARRDLGALTSIPGVGRKIAERLLLELRDKLPALALEGPTTRVAGDAGTPQSAANGERMGSADRLRAALTGMGFKPAEADRAVATLGERAEREGAGPFEETVREALALLAK